jgi:hypothetical protein
VTSEVVVVSNATLADIDGLSNLTTVGLRVYVSGNAQLRSADLRSLGSIGQYDSSSLVFGDLPLLSNLDLRSVVETPSGVQIGNCGATGTTPLALNLAALVTVRGNLTLTGLTRLQNLTGLPALREVLGTLTVNSNPALTTLNLGTLTRLDGNLSIVSNATLPTCEASTLRNRLQMSGFDGTASISGNLTDTCG